MNRKKKFSLHPWEFQCFVLGSMLNIHHFPFIQSFPWAECGCVYQEADRAEISVLLFPLTFATVLVGSVLTCQNCCASYSSAFMLLITCFIYFLSVYKWLNFIPNFIFIFHIHFLWKVLKEGYDWETKKKLAVCCVFIPSSHWLWASLWKSPCLTQTAFQWPKVKPDMIVNLDSQVNGIWNHHVKTVGMSVRDCIDTWKDPG